MFNNYAVGDQLRDILLQLTLFYPERFEAHIMGNKKLNHLVFDGIGLKSVSINGSQSSVGATQTWLVNLTETLRQCYAEKN